MKIIAATDFSVVSTEAARSAARLAQKLGDELLLVHAVEPMELLYPYMDVNHIPELSAGLKKAGERALAQAVAALPSLDRPAETEVLVGRPAEEVVRLAKETNARLIVVGTRSAPGRSRLALGSVARRMMLEATSAVLVLREGQDPFGPWLRGERPLRVVLGVDRSETAEAAARFLGELKAAGPCDVVMVHDYWPPAEYARLGLHGPRSLHLPDAEVVAVLERELEGGIAGRVRALPGQGEVSLVVRPDWGRIGDVLAMEAEALGADLLLVGSEQPRGWQRLRDGSTAVQAVAAAQVPVLCVPARSAPVAARTPTVAPELRSVLVATDFSPIGEAAVPHAYSLLGRGGVVHLCHVRERPLPAVLVAPEKDPGALGPTQRREIELRLEALVPRDAEALGIRTLVTILDGGKAASELLGAARRLGAQTIVLGSHGRSGLKRALLGSVAEEVVRGSEVPVHVVPRPL
jgi:nucleotide-binding universal stress UspA family protein